MYYLTTVCDRMLCSTYSHRADCGVWQSFILYGHKAGIKNGVWVVYFYSPVRKTCCKETSLKWPLYAEWNFPVSSIGPVHFRLKGCCVFLFVFFIFTQIFIEHSVSKQWRPWSDATFWGVWSGSALFAYVPPKWTLGLYGLTLFIPMAFSQARSQNQLTGKCTTHVECLLIRYLNGKQYSGSQTECFNIGSVRKWILIDFYIIETNVNGD